MNLNGKRVLISGGSRGIGESLCKRFTESGAKVAFIYKSNDDAARSVSYLTGALRIKADISEPSQVADAISTAYEYLGGFDVLINNAGISQIKLFTDVTDEEFSQIINTNLGGTFYLSREIAKYMIREQYGRIINVGSMWGKCGASCEVVYSASKAALRGMTMALAKELGPSGITVNCIEPGLIKTEMNASLDEATLRDICDSTPLMRMGEPDDVASLALFLASDSSSFITGQCIGVDGGFAI